MSNIKIKCVIVGDGTVGKTCLLMRYVQDYFPTDYTPTIFDDFVVAIPVNGENYDLHLFDTAGQEEYDQVRKLAFIDVDVFLVCFSIDSDTSYSNVSDVWVPELQRLCPNTPLLLVGTKIDMRSNNVNNERRISSAEGEALKKKLKMADYLECSALTKENVENIFESAVITAIHDSNTTKTNSMEHNIQLKGCCAII